MELPTVVLGMLLYMDIQNNVIDMCIYRPPDKSAYWEIFSVFLIQNICCGYSKEQSQCDGSFEHPKHILKLMGKKKKNLRK